MISFCLSTVSLFRVSPADNSSFLPQHNVASFPCVSLLHKGMEISHFVKEDLSTSDPEKSLKQLGIGNGCEVLLWDGVQVRAHNSPRFPFFCKLNHFQLSTCTHQKLSNMLNTSLYAEVFDFFS